MEYGNAGCVEHIFKESPYLRFGHGLYMDQQMFGSDYNWISWQTKAKSDNQCHDPIEIHQVC